MGDTFGFFGLSNQYNYEYFFDSQYQKDSFTYEIANQTTVSFSYNLASVIIQTEVSPDNIFFALTKIGGLIGLAKLFSIFGFIHEYQFEKDLKKFHKEIDQKEEEIELHKLVRENRETNERIRNQQGLVTKPIKLNRTKYHMKPDDFQPETQIADNLR